MEIQFKHLQRIVKIVVHNTAVSYLKNPDQWEATNNYHKKIFKPYEKNWADYKSSLGFYNGYNFEIAMNGKTRQARKIGETTAAVYQQGLNSGIAVHIVLDGAFDTELPTREQEIALKNLLIKLLSLCKNAKISYHRDFAIKTCPGKLIADDWAKNLIVNNKTMELKINRGHLYLVEELNKFGWSIPEDKIALPAIKTHFEKLGMPLGEPEVFDPDNYFIVYGSTKEQITNFFNV